MEPVIATLVDYVDGLEFTDLNSAVVDAVRVRLVDSMGCMIGGMVSPPGVIARSYAEKVSGDPSASVLGGTQSALDQAAFANTVMQRFLDFNDSNPGGGHFSDIIPALIAAAESVKADGRSLITAIVAGYEVASRLASVTRIRLRGWDNATYINVATALSAGKLLGLTREQLANAAAMASISNISTWASREGEVSMWKACASASSNRHGIFTALLAADGMTGPSEPFSGRNGIFELITGQPFSIDFADGTPLSVTQSSIKKFPCQDDAQGPIEIALSLHDRVTVEQIESIRIDSFHITYSTDGGRVHPHKWDPRTREMADHSLPYLVVVGLVDGKVDMDSFLPQRYLDPDLRPLMERVTIYQDLDFKARYPAEMNNTIAVTHTSGEVVEGEITYPHGHPLNPMSADELNAKFDHLSSMASPSHDACREIRDLAWAIDDCSDVAEFGAAMRAVEPRADVEI